MRLSNRKGHARLQILTYKYGVGFKLQRYKSLAIIKLNKFSLDRYLTNRSLDYILSS